MQTLVVPAVMIMTVTALGTTAHSAPNFNWEVKGRVSFQISDYEEFDANEHCNTSWEFTHKGKGSLPQDNFWYAKCGGEIRAEIHYTIQNRSRSAVIINGSVKLYEGTSDDTRDLDGGYPIAGPVAGHINIPESQPVTKTYTVTNAKEQEPNDRADITITWHKLPLRAIGKAPR
ncbi:hypothetical protein AB0D54_27940 [Streptomyces xanthophaeus]|uniref:hypothetical protein n=1 Tax=Streptomyces xanthophaeus TaxID=67385 RepID=UPI003432BCF2